jgi:hypothetical protein
MHSLCHSPDHHNADVLVTGGAAAKLAAHSASLKEVMILAVPMLFDLTATLLMSVGLLCARLPSLPCLSPLPRLANCATRKSSHACRMLLEIHCPAERA